ncbi:MAG: M18 family aminopeptidase [Proteobacteria bacterium]|nr:M18 family aminopeptidase [Pseudomonadota bacterium]
MKETRLNQELIDFLKASPTPFHAVANMIQLLGKAGFSPLLEADAWQINKGGRYYITRNDSSLIAFTLGEKNLSETGFRMAGAHTDSPCLKVKPIPEIRKEAYLQLGVEVYGGVLLSTWFDRDLSIAGRINWIDKKGNIKKTLIDLKNPVAILPSLAIHFDRNANDNKSINAQTDLPPILLCHADGDMTGFGEMLISHIGTHTKAKDKPVAISSHELCFYDTQPPAFTGLTGDFISGARLDNLLSCYIGLMGLIHADKNSSSLIVLNDHEEVGSASTTGAHGQFLMSVLERLCPGAEEFGRTMARSMMVSIDNAHGVHPNHMGKYDPNHSPLLNHGPAIKINSNQRYASNSDTTAIFKSICSTASVPVQEFVMRSDMACGTTIGPITATKLGVTTIDIGVPTFAMHSIRETAGSKDTLYLSKAVQAYFSLKKNR